MKNLLIYINPLGGFDNETKLLVKSKVIDGNVYCDFQPQSTKTTVIHYLMENDLLEENIMYWVHDFDAFQSVSITEEEIDLGEIDLGLSDYGRMSRWSTGSMFFTKKARDIFKWMTEDIYKRHTDEERALSWLTRHNINDIKKRIKKINISYNFQTNNIRSCFLEAIKPLRVLHFHPFVDKRGINTLDFFLRGKNKINTILASERLKQIFKNYGIT